MKLIEVYEIGKALPLPFSVSSVDKKLSFMLFPYDSKAVINTAFIALLISLIVYPLLSLFSDFLAYLITFIGIVMAIILYFYPTNVYYNHRIGEYNEEMLRAILRLATFVSMDTSLEYAFVETSDHLHGTLKLQFLDIRHRLERKEAKTLGEAIDKYVDVWNEINPVFVKSLRLLQTAALSSQKDRDDILKETTETLMLNYTTMGKRFAETLTDNAKKLISAGVLFPILSLMLLPLLSVFLPEFVRPSMLAFIYVVFFPTLTLLMAMSFSAKRVQVDTVRIEDADEYRPMPGLLLWLCIGIAVVMSVPTLFYLWTVLSGAAGDTETVFALLMGWLMSAGIMGAFYVYAALYRRRYRKLWEEVHEIEQDLPHLLQSFSTYLTLNMSTENVVPEVVNDYVRFGFAKHPVVKAFRRLNHVLLTSKASIEQIVSKQLKHMLPSRKVVHIINQIVSFSKISQASSARVTKMVREQTISVYKLDDYMKTLLAESVSLINVTVTMLAPLLCAAAVIMSMAIVKSLTYITQQLEAIASAFGATTTMGFQIVDTSQVISPIFIEIVVGLYLVETLIILSFFASTINVGNDPYKFFEAVRQNTIGFLIYSVILFGGYIFVVKVFFAGILGVGG